MSKVKILLMFVYNDKMMQNLDDIGICFIASFLRQEGYEVMLSRAHEDRMEFDKITGFGPGIIGLSVYQVSRESVYRVIEKIKQLLPDVFICVGGPLPTYYDVKMMEEFPLIDFVVRGEGELTFWELVSQLPGMEGKNLENIKGLTYRDGDVIKTNEKRPLIRDLDILPMPARDILRDDQLKTAQISTSRGCIGRCSFCISTLYWKKWRGRSVEKVIDEIEYIVKTYGIKTFNFIDGSLEDPDPGLKRIRDIVRGIVKLDLNISYFADFRSEFHRRADHGLLELLNESGLCGVCVGIESANESDLKLYGKLASVEDNVKIVELFRKYEINVEPGFINFNPYSSFEGLQKNIDFLEKYGYASNLGAIINRYAMYKGTRLYNKIKKDSLLKEDQSNEYGYRFVDERIAALFHYANEYLTKIDNDYNWTVFKISHYTMKYLTLLTHLKRQFKIFQEIDGYKEVIRYERLNKELLAAVNSNAAAWFGELLRLAKNGWNKGKVDEVSNRFMNIDYLLEKVGKLNGYKNKLYMKLIKINLGAYLVSMW